jgi:hypothetical protein
MSLEIGNEAVQFPEKEHINGIFVAVYVTILRHVLPLSLLVLVIK